VIAYAVWLYFRFTMSFRDVEDLLAERGIDVSHETIRCWTLKFGIGIAQTLRSARVNSSARRYLDEMVVRICGTRMYLWRAGDDDDEVLDMLLQKRRNKRAGLRLMRKLLKNIGIHPESIVTDGLRSYSAAAHDLNLSERHHPGRMRENNRAENSHLPIRRRDRKMQRFKSQGSAQPFLSVHACIYNIFYTQRHLTTRPIMRQLRSVAHQT
jgi:putative transposase